MSTILKDLKLGSNSYIGTEYKCLVIAEIGQNHQGDIQIAKELIIEAKVGSC